METKLTFWQLMKRNGYPVWFGALFIILVWSLFNHHFLLGELDGIFADSVALGILFTAVVLGCTFGAPIMLVCCIKFWKEYSRYYDEHYANELNKRNNGN